MVEDDLHLLVGQPPRLPLVARVSLEAVSQEGAYCQSSDTKVRGEFFRANVVELPVLRADFSEIDTPATKVLPARAVVVVPDQVRDAALGGWACGALRRADQFGSSRSADCRPKTP